MTLSLKKPSQNTDIQSVITADIVNSSQLKPNEFKKLVSLISRDYKKSDIIEFYRGDSFQVLVRHGYDAFKCMVLNRLQAISFSNGPRIDIRQSIRVGVVPLEVKQIGSFVNDTFLKSGRAFDQFHEGKVTGNLLISCGNPKYDFTYTIIADYLDTLFSLITPVQAKVAYRYMAGQTQKEIAENLKKTTATVNNQMKLARIDEIVNLINKYETLTKDFEIHGQ